MKAQPNAKRDVKLTGINEWQLKVLRHIPILADPSGHAAAEKRLFPDPVTGPDAEPEDREQWEEWVIPEHRRLYDDALERVAADVATATEEIRRQRRRRDQPDLPPPSPIHTGKFQLTIPAGNVDHWYRAMNQARLVMSERYGIDSEGDSDVLLERMIAADTVDRLFEYELFTSFQQWLVVYVMSE